MNSLSDIPVLLLHFNRPDFTRRSLEHLATIAPKKVFVAVDGPRPGRKDDEQNCQEVRSLLSNLPWAAELHFRFLEKNLGCRRAVSSAITWFFDQVEFGVILEDDCLVDPSFFLLCEHGNARFAKETKIMAICAHNTQCKKRGDGSYYFSKIPAVWGWATWKRAWQLYDEDPSSYASFVRSGALARALPDPITRFVWNFKITDSFRGGNSWAFPWIASVLTHGGLAIIANLNMVQNVGYGDQATHAKESDSVFLRDPIAAPEAEIQAPAKIAVNVSADRYFSWLMLQEQVFGRTWSQRLWNVSAFLSRRILGETLYSKFKAVINSHRLRQ